MAQEPEVWLAIPSASPALCRLHLPAWRDMGYRIAVLQNHERADDIPADLVRWIDHYPGWAASINLLCAEVVPASAAVIVSGGDDMLPDPDKRAEDIASEMLDHFGGSFGVMQPQGDTYLGARHYCGSPWIGREFARRMYGGAGPMQGSYHHNWADNELFWVAKCMGLLWARDDLSQRHEHFSRVESDAPDYWNAEVHSHDRADVQLFLDRATQSFPGHEPIGTGAPVYDHRIYAQCNRGIAETHRLTHYGNADGSGVSLCEIKMRDALLCCKERGHQHVGIYGAGSHTRAVAKSLAESPVEIVCVIDDDARLIGTQMQNIEIVSPKIAMQMNLDAVVLSSNAREEELARAADTLHNSGIEIMKLYTDDSNAANQSSALTRAGAS